jgi:hypothetical protein
MKKTINIGGVEYIDASKSESTKATIGGFVAVAGVSLLIVMSLWTIVENIIL